MLRAAESVSKLHGHKGWESKQIWAWRKTLGRLALPWLLLSRAPTLISHLQRRDDMGLILYTPLLASVMCPSHLHHKTPNTGLLLRLLNPRSSPYNKKDTKAHREMPYCLRQPVYIMGLFPLFLPKYSEASERSCKGILF